MSKVRENLIIFIEQAVLSVILLWGPPITYFFTLVKAELPIPLYSTFLSGSLQGLVSLPIIVSLEIFSWLCYDVLTVFCRLCLHWTHPYDSHLLEKLLGDWSFSARLWQLVIYPKVQGKYTNVLPSFLHSPFVSWTPNWPMFPRLLY